MSTWTHIEAHFKIGDVEAWKNLLSDTFLREGLPTGTEGSLDMTRLDGGWYVHGGLRDFYDSDCFGVVAWFVEKCRYADTADLRITVDNGPRYRYEWDQDGLRKIHGILDQ